MEREMKIALGDLPPVVVKFSRDFYEQIRKKLALKFAVKKEDNELIKCLKRNRESLAIMDEFLPEISKKRKI